MALATWLEGQTITGQRHGGAYVVPDVRAIEHARTLLWNLSDYVVTSVQGGSIWLMPRLVQRD